MPWISQSKTLVTEWMESQNPINSLLLALALRPHMELKPKLEKMLSHENHKQRKWRTDILTDKIKFRHIMRDQASHCIMIKG